MAIILTFCVSPLDMSLYPARIPATVGNEGAVVYITERAKFMMVLRTESLPRMTATWSLVRVMAVKQ
jgi:hypothetical protein